MLATYGAYTVIWKEELSGKSFDRDSRTLPKELTRITAAKVFSSMPVFTMLRRALQASFQGLSQFIEGIWGNLLLQRQSSQTFVGKVSLDRLTDLM